MDLEEIHQGMELWKRRQVSLTPRHWQRSWLDADAVGEEAADVNPPAPPAGTGEDEGP